MLMLRGVVARIGRDQLRRSYFIFAYWVLITRFCSYNPSNGMPCQLSYEMARFLAWTRQAGPERTDPNLDNEHGMGQH